MINDVLNITKKYLGEIGVSKEVIENSTTNVTHILCNKLPKVCVLKENRVDKKGNQTHIHITGESIKFFYEDLDLHNVNDSFATDLKMNVLIYAKNLTDLRDRARNKFNIEKTISLTETDDLLKSYTYKKVGRINTTAPQVQLSKIRLDDENFMNLRKLLFANDYLVFYKNIQEEMVVVGIPQEYMENNELDICNHFEEVELDPINDVMDPKKLRSVTYQTIASYEPQDEEKLEDNYVNVSGSISLRKRRTERHQDIVKLLAIDLERKGYDLYEYPVDCLALKKDVNLLFEIKSLDGTLKDEKRQVQKAFSQLCYYEEFYTSKKTEREIQKYAVFENRISDAHINFLKKFNINTIWLNEQQMFESMDGIVNF